MVSLKLVQQVLFIIICAFPFESEKMVSMGKYNPIGTMLVIFYVEAEVTNRFWVDEHWT